MTDLVKYNNIMYNFPFTRLTEVDIRLFYIICSKVKDKGTDVVEISFAELRELSEYSSLHRSNEKFVTDLESMIDRFIECNERIETDSEIIYFNLFLTFMIDTEKQTLTVRVNQDFIDFFSNIAREFTVFELKQYVSVSGKYAKALYRLLKQWRTQGHTPKYTVEELEEKLVTPDYNVKRLMQEVIAPAVEELRKKKVWSNLYVETIYKRRLGKPVDGYVFYLNKKVVVEVSPRSQLKQNRTARRKWR